MLTGIGTVKISYKKWAVTAALLGTMAMGVSSADAGVMPYEQPSVLDRALMDIQEQNQPTDETVLIAPPPPEMTETVVVEQEDETLETTTFAEEPIAVVEPAPQNRIVDVQDNQSFFGLSIGAYDPFTHDDLAASLGIEYQPGIKIAGLLQPLFGAMATNDGTFLGYGGLGVPVELNSNWMLMPSAAIGYYEDGDGYDLDRHAVYRIGAELAYVFENKSRLGLNAHVITNGKSFDSEDRTEVISLMYTMPIGFDGLSD